MATTRLMAHARNEEERIFPTICTVEESNVGEIIS